MGLGSRITGLFTPSGDTIKGTMEGAGMLAKDIRSAITGEVDKEKILELIPRLLAFESSITETRMKLLLADAQGGWLQRNWRPMILCGLFVMIVVNSMGLLAVPLASDAWDVIKIAMGTVAAGQSLEKVADVWNKS